MVPKAGTLVGAFDSYNRYYNLKTEPTCLRPSVVAKAKDALKLKNTKSKILPQKSGGFAALFIAASAASSSDVGGSVEGEDEGEEMMSTVSAFALQKYLCSYSGKMDMVEAMHQLACMKGKENLGLQSTEIIDRMKPFVLAIEVAKFNCL